MSNNGSRPTGTEFVATFGVRPVDVGPFRCHCCGGLMKESFTPWRGYAERTRCTKCGTLYVFTSNDHGCRVDYYATEKGRQIASSQAVKDRTPLLPEVGAAR